MDEPKRKKKRRKEHFVCELDEFEKDRPLVTKTIAGRSVTCLSRSGEVHAFDSKCYHLGGSLENADIEDVGERLCVVCPFHKFTIDVKTGEGLTMRKGDCVGTKKKKQRIHTVVVKENKVFVKLTSKGNYASDGGYHLEEDLE